MFTSQPCFLNTSNTHRSVNTRPSQLICYKKPCLFLIVVGVVLLSPTSAVAQAPTAPEVLDNLYQAQLGITDVHMRVRQESLTSPQQAPIVTEMEVKMIVNKVVWMRSVVQGLPQQGQVTSETAVHGDFVYSKSTSANAPPKYEKFDGSKVPGVDLARMRRAPLQDPQVNQALQQIKQVAEMLGNATISGAPCWVIGFKPTVSVVQALAGITQGTVSAEDAQAITNIAGEFRVYVDQQTHYLRRMEMLDPDGRAVMSVTISHIAANQGLQPKDCLIDAPQNVFVDQTAAMLRAAEGAMRAPSGNPQPAPPLRPQGR